MWETNYFHDEKYGATAAEMQQEQSNATESEIAIQFLEIFAFGKKTCRYSRSHLLFSQLSQFTSLLEFGERLKWDFCTANVLSKTEFASIVDLSRQMAKKW